MGLNLTSVYQRPYNINERQGYVKRKKDEDGSQAKQTQREEQASSQQRSRGLQYVDNGSDQFTRNTAPVDGQPWQKQIYQNAQSQRIHPQAQAAYSAPIDAAAPRYDNPNTSINIAQILKDFKNTAVAIGTPDELKEEVNGYVDLIQKQVAKDEPNVRLIKSNLKNASTILDNYISQTLNKDSKVVENWVDALFMQNINFKYDEEEINPQFLVKFPEGSTEQASIAPAVDETVPAADIEVIKENEIPVEDTIIKPETEQTKVYIPQDSELKSLFIRSKKLAYANEPRKAIENFQKALERANEVGDKETKSKIFFEIGKIYDDYDYPALALKSYHKSIQNTTDNNVKTRAHYSMAQIYDDVNQIEPALDHYYVSAAYGGESDNFAAQSTSLAKIGNIFSDMYEDDAFEFLTTAKDIAAQSDNLKVKGFVSASLGRAYERFGEPQEALKSYSEAVKNYADAESPVKAAQNYLSAADIMLDFNSKKKARGLLNKARQFAQEANEETLLNEINNRLAQIA